MTDMRNSGSFEDQINLALAEFLGIRTNGNMEDGKAYSRLWRLFVGRKSNS
jgi:hypothetical protein